MAEQNDKSLNRRQFLGATAAVGAGLLAGCASDRGPIATTAASQRRILGANDRIRLGWIGCGGMAWAHMDRIKANHPKDVTVVSIADVYEPYGKRGQEFFPEADLVVEHERVLDRKDVDAVFIVSPEHWHHDHLLAAVAAGKDAYCEKPMAWSLEQAADMVRAVRKTDCIVQIGMQRRSTPAVLQAKALVDEGRLGEISLVRAWWYWNHPAMRMRPESELKLHGPLDWERFQKPCPPKFKHALQLQRFFHWRFFWAYSGGNMTDQGTHLMDVIQWFRNKGEPPRAAVEMGSVYQQVGYETPDTFCATFEYPDFLATWTLTYTNNYEDAWGICFQGNKGTLLLDDSGAKLWDEPWKEKDGKPPAPVEQIPGGLSVEAHETNFFECLRTRKQPNAPVEVGQRAVAGLHLANLAHFRKRRVELQPDLVTVRS